MAGQHTDIFTVPLYDYFRSIVPLLVVLSLILVTVFAAQHTFVVKARVLSPS